MIVDGMEITERVIARFQVKVQRGAIDQCWPWQGAPDHAGYGRLHIGGGGGRHVRAHRIALALHDGADLGPGVEACHRCDNPCCVNPQHLFRGSHLDNMRDRDQKGRVRSGERHGSHTRPERRARGERHGRRVLTLEQVLTIRNEYVPRIVSCQKLADKYGVGLRTIQDIVWRNTWTHV